MYFTNLSCIYNKHVVVRLYWVETVAWILDTKSILASHFYIQDIDVEYHFTFDVLISAKLVQILSSIQFNQT